MFWVRYLLPPGVVYVTKLSNSFGLRLCPSRIKVFRLIIPLGLFSFLWESQFTVESGSLDLKFESDNDVNEIWEVVVACILQYLEQYSKFCGTSSPREFIVCLGMMLMKTLRRLRNSTTTIPTISHYKFSSGKSWKQHNLSSAGILCGEWLCKHTYLPRKVRLWVGGFFCVSFHFFFFFISFSFSFYWAPQTVEVWLGIENGKKKSSVQGHISHVVLFFLLPCFLNLSRFGYSR